MEPHELNALGIVAVHVVGDDVHPKPEDLDKSPTHVVTLELFPIPTSVPAGQQAIPPFLQLDPLRRRALILGSGSGLVAICHSLDQAVSVVNTGRGAPFFNCPGTFHWNGSAPLWIVSTAAVVSTAAIGALTERFGD